MFPQPKMCRFIRHRSLHTTQMQMKLLHVSMICYVKGKGVLLNFISQERIDRTGKDSFN